MQFSILDFLNTLDREVTAASRLLPRVREEISTFRDIRQSLEAIPETGGDGPATDVTRYLEDLALVEQKVKQPHLLLLCQSNTTKEKEINQGLLRLLKKLNTA